MSQFSSYSDLYLENQIAKLKNELIKAKTAQKYILSQFKSVDVGKIEISNYPAVPMGDETGCYMVIRFVGQLKNKIARAKLTSTGYNSKLYTINQLQSDSPEVVRFFVQAARRNGTTISFGVKANMGGYLEVEKTYNAPPGVS